MPTLHSITLTLDAVEQSTIVAALALWRDAGDARTAELEYLAGCCGEVPPLDAAEIDQLIAKIEGAS